MPASPYCLYRLARRRLARRPASLRTGIAAAPRLTLSRALPAVLLAGASVLGLAGCGSLERVAGAVTPYRAPVVQGNFVSREQAQQLKPGMSRLQVRDAIGSPLLASAFHADRWDYIFTLRRQGLPEQAYRLTAYFKGDLLERFESDTLPSESEFVATVDTRAKSSSKPPALEASDAQLARFPVPAPAPAPAPQPSLPTSYPPLEPAAR